MIVACHACGSDFIARRPLVKHWLAENWLGILIGLVAVVAAMKASSAAEQLLRGVSVAFEIAMEDPIVPPE